MLTTVTAMMTTGERVVQTVCVFTCATERGITFAPVNRTDRSAYSDTKRAPTTADPVCVCATQTTAFPITVNTISCYQTLQSE